ncbi:hypothetical protein ACJJTC_015486, partial [Scirpophaga incertulas]
NIKKNGVVWFCFCSESYRTLFTFKVPFFKQLIRNLILVTNMDLLTSIYSKSISENEKTLKFWEEYLKSLINLQFDVYSNKLSVPILVPVGSKILFRGELKHTNEVTVSLGADYFVKCSLNQAEILKQHRVKDAQSKVNMLLKEKEYLRNHVEYGQQTINNCFGQEIVEPYSEEEDKLWREKHKQNVRNHKRQNTNKSPNEQVPDEELWNRLDELELQEEVDDFYISKEHMLERKDNECFESKTESMTIEKNLGINFEECFNLDSNSQLCSKRNEFAKSENTSNINLLQTILARQDELIEKLQNIESNKRICITKKDLEERLDEIEQLDELEDEINRLNDTISQYCDEDYKEENITQESEVRTKVTFLDENESETLEISVQHSAILPSIEDYNPTAGIQKPSDIYFAYDYLFNIETYSILKKTKYDCDKVEVNNFESTCEKKNDVDNKTHDMHLNKTIIVHDVEERQSKKITSLDYNEAKPMSIFKRQRMQKRL